MDVFIAILLVLLALFAMYYNKAASKFDATNAVATDYDQFPGRIGSLFYNW